MTGIGSRQRPSGRVPRVGSNHDLIEEAAMNTSSHERQRAAEMVGEPEVEGEFDTARRYDEVIEMGEDSALEDDGLGMGLQNAEIGGLPSANDL